MDNLLVGKLTHSTVQYSTYMEFLAPNSYHSQAAIASFTTNVAGFVKGSYTHIKSLEFKDMSLSLSLTYSSEIANNTFSSLNEYEEKFQLNDLLTTKVMLLQSCKIRCAYS